MTSAAKQTARVAVVQAASVAFDSAATLTKLEKLCKEASNNGAQLVLFPEAFISCYPRGSYFDTVIGCRFQEGREKFQMYWESSVEVPGPITDKLSQIAKENKVHLVVGIIEREGGTLYCTVIFFNNDGTYLGKHRKLMPTALERLVWGFGDGSTLPVFDTPLGKLGAVICWENYMPLLRMTMYSKGIQIYCAPTADDRDQWLSTVRHIALEGRCFVLCCNQFVRRSDLPPKFVEPEHEKLLRRGEDDDPILCRGGSCIISPMGDFLAGPHYEGETILYANLDLSDVVKAKFDFDVVGHYARPDVFTLHVNEKPNQSVVYGHHQGGKGGHCKNKPAYREDPEGKLAPEL